MNLNKSFIIFWFIFSMCLISAIIALPTLSKEEIFKNFLKKKLSKEEMEKLLRILSATTGTFRPSHHNYWLHLMLLLCPTKSMRNLLFQLIGIDIFPLWLTASILFYPPVVPRKLTWNIIQLMKTQILMNHWTSLQPHFKKESWSVFPYEGRLVTQIYRPTYFLYYFHILYHCLPY